MHDVIPFLLGTTENEDTTNDDDGPGNFEDALFCRGQKLDQREGRAVDGVSSFFHSLKSILDRLAARFWQTADGIGFLSPGLNLNAIPEPSGVIMITCNFFPGYVFIRMAEPKESPGLDDDLLGRQMNFLRY